MKPTYQIARAAAVFQTQHHDIPVSDEYRAARSLLTSHREEIPEAEGDNLMEHAANVLADYVLSIPDQYEEGKRAGYADAQPQPEPNPMPSLFDRFGGPVK